MANTEALAGRIERLRALMAQRGYDAVILRHNPDLRWLTGAERVFDFEIAHTAFVTAEGLWLHTDSRYFNTFRERLGEDCPWVIDQDVIEPTAWAANHVARSRARVVAIEDSCELSFYDGLQVELGKRSVACLLPRMHDDIADLLRSSKDAEELEQLREAQRITDDAFEHICAYIKPGMTEQQVRVELENYMLTHGADALSFDSIIAAGPNGANPHARPSDFVISEGDFIVMDYGAGYHDYHADMTRTVCVGEPSEEQRRVYDIVRKANETCAAAIKPGLVCKDVHQIAVDIITEAGYGEYFMHGLGHGVGVQIHEKPFFNPRSTDVLKVGSVVTDEPGIYLPGRFGVRIEDCGVVDEAGYHPFSRISHDLVSVG